MRPLIRESSASVILTCNHDCFPHRAPMTHVTPYRVLKTVASLVAVQFFFVLDEANAGSSKGYVMKSLYRGVPRPPQVCIVGKM